MTTDTAVENPIINSPFVEPQCHWEIKKGEQPKTVTGRRDAYYYYRVPDSAKRISLYTSQSSPNSVAI